MKCRVSILAAVLLAAGGTAVLGACSPPSAMLGGGAATGILAEQERSVGEAVDDLTIRIDLNTLFFQNDHNLYNAIGLDVLEGRVLLYGVVHKPSDRAKAAKIAWKADGVKEVINELQVSPEASGVVDFARDSWIVAQLEGKLLVDKDVASINYKIHAVDGIIYLLGIAQNKAELERVIGHARNIPYVRKVVSHVMMKDDPRRGPVP